MQDAASDKPAGKPARGLHTLFMSDKPPFAISIYFAAIAWVFTHSITTIADQKLIEYDPATTTRSGSLLYEVTLRNISKFRFDELEFMIETEDLVETSPFNNIIAVAPANSANQEAPIPGKGVVTYKIGIFHPGQEYKLVAEYKGENSPTFRFNSIEGGEIKPVQMIESSAWTWGIRHQGGLITAFVLVWGLATFWTLSVSISARRQAQGQSQ